MIAPGQVTTTLLICADANAKLAQAAPLRIQGQAGKLVREANPDDRLKLISLMPSPDVLMTAETKELTIEQGGSAQVTVSIKRQNEFGGRVPIDVRNLPPHVLVPDVGLNGILLNEDETRRSFTIQALPDAPAGEQLDLCGWRGGDPLRPAERVCGAGTHSAEDRSEDHGRGRASYGGAKRDPGSSR